LFGSGAYLLVARAAASTIGAPGPRG
jgi:hypothetical protein